VPTEAKVREVEELKARWSEVHTAILTEYRGLTVQQLSELRRQLRAASAEYRVVKNRLARLAIQDSPMAALAPHLVGPTGMAWTRRDPVLLAKMLQGFARNVPALSVKAGFVEGQVVPAEGVRSLADLPSREVLLGQVVGGLQAPLAGLIGTLEGLLRSLVIALEQVRAKQEAQG